MQILSRRSLLKHTLTAAGGATSLLALSPAFADAIGQACGLTPAQTSGPFYPVEDQLDKDNDLTRVKGLGGKPLGEVIYLRGSIQDAQCRPLGGAHIEIWQACASGRYNHPSDTNTAAIDPNFQYWGQAMTREDGSFLFKTILPGAYPAASDWQRPPHIHVRVSKLGYHELITQLYFAGDPLNDVDKILRSIPRRDRSRVIGNLVPSPEGFEPGTRLADFTINILAVE